MHDPQKELERPRAGLGERHTRLLLLFETGRLDLNTYDQCILDFDREQGRIRKELHALVERSVRRAKLACGVAKGGKLSSFSNPHFMYLFELTNGKKKLAYGQSPEDALEILRIRLSEQEMAEIVTDRYIKVNQRELRQYIKNLG